MLTAGYLEDWRWHATLSGAPQGGVVSPILSNIYLDKLDEYVETVLIPQHTRGKERRRRPEYTAAKRRRRQARQRGDWRQVRDLTRRYAACQAGIPTIPATGGCGTRATPTTTSSGSSDPRPKPSRSSVSWRGSCATNSRSSSTPTKP